MRDPQGNQKSEPEARPDTGRRNRFSLSNFSIARRLPILIGLLLIAIIFGSTWASYRGVKESALQVGRERLLSLTQQLANQSQQSLPIVLGRTFAAANDPALHVFLRSQSSAARPGAQSILKQFATSQDPNSLQVELWNSDRTLALIEPEGASPEPADLTAEFKECATDPFKVVGPLRVVNSMVVYTATAGVKDDAGKVFAYLVRWRRASPTVNVRKQLADLLGSQAAVYYGNSQGDVWTDLEKAVPKPPVNLGATLEVTHYTRDGNSVMALGRPISGTPWFLIVEFPEASLLAHSNQFLRRMLLIDLALLLVGVAGAFALSRNITGPLYSLTQAAAGISEGDYSYVADIRRTDELGILAGAINVMIGKIRDSQRHLEREVQQRTGELKAANTELEAFSYSVSHDLRAPLRHINGFSQALLEEYSDQLDDVGQGFLQELSGATEEMAQLIDGMLQLARITRSEMHSEVVNLSELAHVLTAQLQEANSGQTAMVSIEEGLSTLGDKRLLQVVLSNLLGNSWKFSSKREQAQITFGQTTKNDAPCYFIRDNGAGFEMAYVAKLFRAFQRLHTAGEFEGTGIGLATVQRIVNRHGGRVWAEGKLDEGATFYFTLPGSRGLDNGEQSDPAG